MISKPYFHIYRLFQTNAVDVLQVNLFYNPHFITAS